MRQAYKFALLVVSLFLPSLSLAQAAPSTVSSPVIQPTADSNPAHFAKAKPETKKPDKPAAPKAEKHFVEVYSLTHDVTPGAASCYTGTLKFPANNAAEVVKLFPAEQGFTLTAVPPDKIVIYSTKATPPPAADLRKLEKQLSDLASSDFSDAKAIRVSAGSADKSIAHLVLPPNHSIVVRAIGDNCVLIVSKSQADPVTVAALTESIPGIYWRQPSAPPTQRLFYTDATTVAKKLSGSDDSKGDSSKSETGKDDSSNTKSDSDSDSDSDSESDSKSKDASSSGSKKPSTGGAAQKAKAKPNGNKKNTADAANQADQSKTEDPDSTAKDTDNKDDSGKSSSADNANADKTGDKATTPQPKSLSMQPVNDTLVYSNEDGSDRGIFERNRLMAVLDLPRPEVLMNVWSLQVSTRDPATASLEAQSAGELVSHHNEALENAIENGWVFLSKKMVDPNFFEPRFYEYVTKKFAEGREYSENLERAEPADKHPSKNELEQVDEVGEVNRKRWGWCAPDQYCLGFIHAFEPVRPTLTNLLLTLISARDSHDVANKTIEIMQCPNERFNAKDLTCKPAEKLESSCKPGSKSTDPCADNTAVAHFDSCVGDELKRVLTLKKQSAANDCELKDRIDLLTQINLHTQEGLQLHCFQEQAMDSFGPDSTQTGEYATTRVGLLRAAVADFLFNYKWATQYPHDFIPYDLTQSAQELNAEFNPLVLAFNRDVKAFAQNLQTELQCKHDANTARLHALAWFKKSDETFLNEGMISVRGISGVESIVDTVTQSFFDATNPPNLTDLVKSISDAEKNVPGVLKPNLTANEASVLLGALNSVQPAEAKIGRELKLDITPHALAGASAAELEVKLTANETANPTLFKADQQEEDTLSRISKHETNTRVRVESLKLFDVSSFSAMLQRPRSKFPILPPFFEIPYFGSFIGWPLPGVQVYHRSTAIVSAIIVPTAADLAFGIEFGSDRVCEISPKSKRMACHTAHSPYDFGTLPLRNFHKVMVQCFASGGRSPYVGRLEEPEERTLRPDDFDCSKLSLTNPETAVPAFE